MIGKALHDWAHVNDTCRCSKVDDGSLRNLAGSSFLDDNFTSPTKKTPVKNTPVKKTPVSSEGRYERTSSDVGHTMSNNSIGFNSSPEEIIILDDDGLKCD